MSIRSIVAVVVVSALFTTLASGQEPGEGELITAVACVPCPTPNDPAACTRVQLDCSIREVWRKAVAEALEDGRISAEPPRLLPWKEEDARRRAHEKVYRSFIEHLLQSPQMKNYLTLTQENRDNLMLATTLARESGRLARSFDAAATNPLAVNLLERSGITEFVSLATQATTLFAADDTALTINLGAAGLFRNRLRRVSGPAARLYQDAGFWNRVAGSLTLGSKVPEKEITGVAGLPDADALLDVVIWDLKVRIKGDRDPRARRWEQQLLGELGGLSRFQAIASGTSNVPVWHREAIVSEIFTDIVQARTKTIADAIGRSLQVSVKVSGQHLTEQEGRNKFAIALLADNGIGPLDVTLNVSYSATQDVRSDARVFTVKQLKATAGLVGTFWRDAVVAGRGCEFALAAEGRYTLERATLPFATERTYRTGVTLKVPLSKTLELPFSVMVSDDPNNLAKERFVTGRVGVTYDFGALTKLLQQPVP